MSTTQASPAPHVGVSNLVNAVGQLVAPIGIEPRKPSYAGLRYRTERQRGIRPLADVYLPGGVGPHPSVVLVHGGGFVIGSRSMKPMRYLATRLCNAGLAVATFDYRMVFRGARKLDEAVDDVRAMLGWWGEQSERFGLDTGHVTMAGLSAGASLTLLAAPNSPLPLNHVVSVFALYDLSGIRGRLPRLLSRLLTGSRDPGVWQEHSPSRKPLFEGPLTMLHGTEDDLTPLGLAHEYKARREQAGLQTTLHVYDGAPHGFFNDSRLPVADLAFQDFLNAVRPQL